MMLSFIPPIIAHRGACASAPENTMIAFTKAAQLGVKWIEFDVMQAACGKPIVFHDESLERTTNATGKVSDYPYAFLQALDAGSWFDPVFSGEKIPTFRQVLEFLRTMHMAANIEIKAPVGCEKPLVESMLEEIAPFYSMPDPTILFSSFSVDALQWLRKYSPQAFLGLLLHEWREDWQAVCQSLDCVSIHVNEAILTPDKVKEIKQMGKYLLCYTVNDPRRALELSAWGVDAIFTDVPDQLLAIINRDR